MEETILKIKEYKISELRRLYQIIERNDMMSSSIADVREFKKYSNRCYNSLENLIVLSKNILDILSIKINERYRLFGSSSEISINRLLKKMQNINRCIKITGGKEILVFKKYTKHTSWIYQLKDYRNWIIHKDFFDRAYYIEKGRKGFVIPKNIKKNKGRIHITIYSKQLLEKVKDFINLVESDFC